jgi:uncharacterized repeat protein (TIGR03803 family)
VFLPQSISRVSHQLAVFVLLTLFLILAAPMYSQTYTVLQNFSGANGNGPGSPILDPSGNVYGSTPSGGPGEFGGFGNVYKLARAGEGWILDNLYNFKGENDGSAPLGALTFGPSRVLFGTATAYGANLHGTVFQLQPPPTFCRAVSCPWNITVLYAFRGGTIDGAVPNGNVAFDAAGNMYGTTNYGGQNNYGTIWELTRSGGTWTETVLYSFDGTHGSYPLSGVALDSAGNLYGTTSAGGANGYGEVYELTHSGSNWSIQVLHSLQNGSDGRSPIGGVVLDNAGNVYASAQHGGQNSGGTVFELSPANGAWNFSLLYSLSGLAGPSSSLTLDSSGSLYGTTYQDGNNQVGNVFELSPSNGSWTYADLHDFSGSDGKLPLGSVVLDASGDIFGTASEGGSGFDGVVFEIAR